METGPRKTEKKKEVPFNMMEKQAYLNMKRTERLSRLVGRFVVIADNPRRDNEILYFQDPEMAKLSKYGRAISWTRFMVNAMAFDTAEAARDCASRFKFNNPRIAQI